MPWPHDLMDPEKQAAADHSRGMKPGEILLLKTAGLEQNHGKRVAQREHDGGARRRREIQRTGFLFDVDVEDYIRVLGQARAHITADRHDLDLKSRDRGQNPEQLFSFPARAEGENYIAVGHHSEVAMQGIERIEDDGGRARAGKGRSNFSPDVPGFPDPEDNDFAACFYASLDQGDRLGKVRVQPFTQALELKDLDIENAAGL